jgi:hypothetical protein
MQLLRHARVLEPVIEVANKVAAAEVREAADPVAELAKDLSVRGRGQSELYEVSYVSANPIAAHTILNAVVDSYFRFLNDTESQSTQQLLEMLTDHRDQRLVKLRAEEEKVRKLATDVVGAEPIKEPDETDHSLSALQEIKRQLIAAEVEMAVTEAKLAATAKLHADQPPAVAEWHVASQVSQHPRVTALNQLIEEKQDRVRDTIEVSRQGEKDPLVLRIRSQIQEHLQDLEKLQSDLEAETREQLLELEKRARDETVAELQGRLETFRLMFEHYNE